MHSLASSAVELNLQLMKWRIMPQINLNRISETRCLLLGAGTLGCNVARLLLGWGVRKMTLLDNGQVSMSNPVRQSLYSFQDSLKHQSKAEIAAESLKNIYPNIVQSFLLKEVNGVNFDIPMPGHLLTDKKNVARLDDFIRSHDLIFLLTDSRESRWLPSVLSRHHGKMTINMALGYDTFLVMRHGTVSNSLGCYFCSDVVGPTDSLSRRTLDEQCTVTRPGISMIASGLGVELAISLLQHPQRFFLF